MIDPKIFDLFDKSPESEVVRGLVGKKLIELEEILNVILPQDIYDHYMIVLAALGSHIKMPKVLYDRLKAKGYEHPAGIRDSDMPVKTDM